MTIAGLCASNCRARLPTTHPFTDGQYRLLTIIAVAAVLLAANVGARLTVSRCRQCHCLKSSLSLFLRGRPDSSILCSQSLHRPAPRQVQSFHQLLCSRHIFKTVGTFFKILPESSLSIFFSFAFMNTSFQYQQQRNTPLFLRSPGQSSTGWAFKPSLFRGLKPRVPPGPYSAAQHSSKITAL